MFNTTKGDKWNSVSTTNGEYRELLDHPSLSCGGKLPQFPAHSTEASLSRCQCVCETTLMWEDVYCMCHTFKCVWIPVL